MSLRGVPASIEARLASLEAYVRAEQSKSAKRPIESRYLYSDRGDILIALGPGEPQPLHRPSSIPSGPGIVVPRYAAGKPLAVEWAFVPNVTAHSLT